MWFAGLQRELLFSVLQSIYYKKRSTNRHKPLLHCFIKMCTCLKALRVFVDNIISQQQMPKLWMKGENSLFLNDYKREVLDLHLLFLRGMRQGC